MDYLCDDCNGSGKDIEDYNGICLQCEGTGILEETHVLHHLRYEYGEKWLKNLTPIRNSVKFLKED